MNKQMKDLAKQIDYVDYITWCKLSNKKPYQQSTLKEYLFKPKQSSDEGIALLFNADDGTVSTVRPTNEYFTLTELQSLVNGYIEIHSERVNDNLVVVNEEGILLNLKINYTFKYFTGITAYGNVLLCPGSIFEKPDKEFDWDEF